MISAPSPRRTFLLIFAACTALMVFALILEHIFNLAPCPLCLTQRALVIFVGITAIIAWLHGPDTWGTKVYAAVSGFFAVLGIGVAGRHVWLQHLPADEVPTCGPPLEAMMDYLPLQDVIVALFQGDGNCAEVVWNFLGLSIPEWTLIVFIMLSAVCIWQILRKKQTT